MNHVPLSSARDAANGVLHGRSTQLFPSASPSPNPTPSSDGLDSGDTAVLITVIVVVLFLTGLAVWIVLKGLRIVRQAEVMIIERMGRYKETLKPGVHWLWPIIDMPRTIKWRRMEAKWNAADSSVRTYSTERIDLREHVIDFGRQNVITKDTVQVEIDALVYFRITDPRVAVYRVQTLPDAIEFLTQATLRNIIAQMTLDDTFSSREQINNELLGKVTRDTERWGVTITRVEIFNIDPPTDIEKAMERQIQAERKRRSQVLHADGSRESAIIESRGSAAMVVLSADGERASSILRAKGRAEARKLTSQAEAKALTSIRQAVQPYGMRGVDYLAAVEYLNSLTRLGSTIGKVHLIPSETLDIVKSVLKAPKTAS